MKESGEKRKEVRSDKRNKSCREKKEIDENKRGGTRVEKKRKERKRVEREE